MHVNPYLPALYLRQVATEVISPPLYKQGKCQALEMNTHNTRLLHKIRMGPVWLVLIARN